MPDLPPTPVPEEPDDLARVRELILASHADIVPELVQGDSVVDLVASIESARAAYTRVIATVPIPAPTVTIPAGGNTPVMLDIDSLPTAEKIRRGLAANTRKD